jgi:maleate isomerase
MNRDVLGWRAKFGVLAPSTNTIVQPEFDDLRPVGVTNHYSRIYTPNVAAEQREPRCWPALRASAPACWTPSAAS